ncbi:MAG TPA: hypothetical protein VMD91_05060 [Candidatus Sulfotelmatobacter sp.]|nr:hypothetical protein [Candidatus Sulfotelmatobacter sp.]
MTRVNYLRPRRDVFAALARRLDRRTRVPLASLAAALLAVAALCFVDDLRLHAARAAGARAAARLGSAHAALDAMRAAAADVDRLRALSRHVDELATSGTRSASHVALLGNRLAHDAWLTTVRLDGPAVALEGHGAALRDVGDALASLRRVPGYGAARLVSVRRDAARNEYLYAVALEAPW